MDPFEKDILLSVFASLHQVLVLAAGFVIDTRLGLGDDQLTESRVQDPTSCSWSEWSLQRKHVDSVVVSKFYEQCHSKTLVSPFMCEVVGSCLLTPWFFGCSNGGFK